MQFMPTQINLTNIKINSVGQGSNVKIGPSRQRRIINNCKKSQPFGQQNADYTKIIRPIGVTEDSDISDSQSWKINK